MSDKTKVLITVPFRDDLVQRFRDASPQLEILYRPSRNYTDIVTDVWADAEVLYTGNIFPPADSMPKLKWLQTHSAGVDKIIKQPVVQNHPDLIITSTRGIHATNMAEFVMAFILMFGHRVPPMMNDQRRKEWADNRDKFLPLELRKATVGIVGYGAIGREVARLVKAFGGTVLASKRNAKVVEDREHFTFEGTGDPEGDYFDRLYPAQAVATMARDSDFLVVTVPFTESTEGMIGAKVLKAMKKGSFLINVGRGGVVEEAALLDALKSGQLGGAAMDVFEQEPLPEDSPLWTAPNMIITPHVSGNTTDYHDKAAAVFEENLRRYAEGESLLNLVDRTAGY